MPLNYCSGAAGLVAYTNTNAPVLSYDSDAETSAVGVCSAVGLAPAAVADISSVEATLAACDVPSSTYVYTDAPSYTSEDGYCPFVAVTQTGAAATYSATLLPSTFGCSATGFGALVVCA